jgi:hypothetical protein
MRRWCCQNPLVTRALPAGSRLTRVFPYGTIDRTNVRTAMGRRRRGSAWPSPGPGAVARQRDHDGQRLGAVAPVSETRNRT